MQAKSVSRSVLPRSLSRNAILQVKLLRFLWGCPKSNLNCSLFFRRPYLSSFSCGLAFALSDTRSISYEPSMADAMSVHADTFKCLVRRSWLIKWGKHPWSSPLKQHKLKRPSKFIDIHNHIQVVSWCLCSGSHVYSCNQALRFKKTLPGLATIYVKYFCHCLLILPYL